MDSPSKEIYVLRTENEKVAARVETLTKEKSTMRNTEYNLKLGLNHLNIQNMLFFRENTSLKSEMIQIKRQLASMKEKCMAKLP